MTTNQQKFDYSVNLLQSILWEYSNSPNLTALINAKQAWYDQNQSEFWNDWFNNVFNLQTADEFGCAVWAIILGIPLTLIQAASTAPAWGFDTNPNYDNAGFAPTDGEPVGLTLDEQRIILRLRYFQLTSNGTVPDINKFLKYLFADYGSVYVLDGLNMTCIYVFRFRPTTALLTALKNLDLLPRPAGVKLKIEIAITPSTYFGFGPFWANFDNGTFGD